MRASAHHTVTQLPVNPVENVRTVSDTKRAFYQIHTRPVNSIYRRVVEELMVEMHLLSVNVGFQYDPVYALGVVSSFDRLMRGYRPEKDKDSIFEALCRSTGGDPHQYRRDAEAMAAAARVLSQDDLSAILTQPETVSIDNPLKHQLQSISSASNFKYSRLFAIGLLAAIEQVDAELAKDDKQLPALLSEVSGVLALPEDKLKKDLELYLSNVGKMEQAQSVMADVLAAERKKRADRERAKAESSQSPEGEVESQEPETENS